MFYDLKSVVIEQLFFAYKIIILLIVILFLHIFILINNGDQNSTKFCIKYYWMLNAMRCPIVLQHVFRFAKRLHKILFIYCTKFHRVFNKICVRSKLKFEISDSLLCWWNPKIWIGIQPNENINLQDFLAAKLENFRFPLIEFVKKENWF